MSSSKRYASGLVLALWATWASAGELPPGSILKRYGVSPDQLPAGQPAPVDSQPATSSRFRLEPEQPVVNLRLGDNKVPDTTGNISIDHANARERQRCRQVRDELVKRGKAAGVFCEPGQGGLPGSPWSP
ncbi:hypothetical protein H7A76_12840 [Pseudomonas sp. MSSRFD41]|uniref:hypothetical protein n=1 Tax=Pseudomonas sp. MSSRFD41 TaxID=1310370 RepID=UPI00163B5773|nr:hypothetical protein [Pseudomonas sp. MSSRFD41]MBC2656323.1 hypothetical protein [Pseudomonas sp. MSSRFD41]